jgi:hypothetical protein
MPDGRISRPFQTLFVSLAGTLLFAAIVMSFLTAGGRPSLASMQEPGDVTSVEQVSGETQDPDAQELILLEIEALEDSLAVALHNMKLGREQITFIRKELERLQEKIDLLAEEPGSYMLMERLLKLRSGLLESGLRLRVDMPMLEDPEAPELEAWRRIFPEMGEFVETRTRKEIFMIGRDVEVGLFERVRGDVVVIGGEVTVTGAVGGNVVSVGNDIHVTSTGRIEGDAVTIGGSISQDPGGTIKGDWIDTSTILPGHLFLGFRPNPFAWFMLVLTGVAFVLAATLITGLIAPRNVDRVEHQVRAGFGTSFLVGLATEVFLPVVIVLLCITIIGIPVAIILIPITLIGLMILGFTGVAKAVGRGAEHRGLKIGDSTLAMITVGVLILEALYLVGRAFGFAPGVMHPLAFLTTVMGGLVLYVAWTAGLGAALMTRFGTRTPGERREPVPPKPAPPPVGSEAGV